MRGNALVIGIIVIALIAGGAYYLLSRDGTEPSTTTPPPPAAGIVEEGSGVNDGAAGGETTTPPAPSTGTSGARTVEVVYSDTGYSPAEVSVKKGDTVKFTNRSTKEMWPASAIHPTHSIYPEKSASDCLGSSFDACDGIAVGGSWSFTFNSVGSWRYHDHLQASRVGTINVTE